MRITQNPSKQKQAHNVILDIQLDKTRKQLSKPNHIRARNNIDDHWKYSINLRLHAKNISNKINVLTNDKFKILTSYSNKDNTTYKTQSIQEINTFIPLLDSNTIINYKTKQNKTIILKPQLIKKYHNNSKPLQNLNLSLSQNYTKFNKPIQHCKPTNQTYKNANNTIQTLTLKSILQNHKTHHIPNYIITSSKKTQKCSYTHKTPKTPQYINIIKKLLMKIPLNFMFQNRPARTRTTARIVTAPMDTTTNNSLDKATAMEVEDSSSPNNKRGTGEKTPTSQKKSRNSTKLVNTTPRPHHFSYGFPMMEALARERRDQPYEAFPKCDMLEMGYLESEARELQIAQVAFLRIFQTLWPSTRIDEAIGQHYHLTQIPFDVEMDNTTGYALVYQLVLHYSKPKKDYTSATIVKMTIERLQSMNIILGDIPEPIAPLCNSIGSKAWNGMIMIHLKDPIIDGTALLKGKRVFALELDGSLYVAKVAKGYYSLAPTEALSTTITSPNLVGLYAYQLMEEIVKDGFTRKFEFEITQIVKDVDEDHTYIIATSLD